MRAGTDLARKSIRIIIKITQNPISIINSLYQNQTIPNQLDLKWKYRDI